MNTVFDDMGEKHCPGNGARATGFDIQAILTIACLLMQNYDNHARVLFFFFRFVFVFVFVFIFSLAIFVNNYLAPPNGSKRLLG